MSYLTEKTSSGSSIQGIKLEDCSDVSGTPATGQILKYNGSNFAPASMTSDEKGFNFCSDHGAVRPGVGTTNYYGPGQAYRWRLLYFYDGNKVRNNIYNLGSGSFRAAITTSSTGWGELEGAYLPAGTYKVSFNLVAWSNQSTSESTWRFATGPAEGTGPTTANTNLIGPYFYHAPRVGRFSNTPKIVLNLTNSTTYVGLRCTSGSDTSLARPTGQSHWYQFHAEKIG